MSKENVIKPILTLSSENFIYLKKWLAWIWFFFDKTCGAFKQCCLYSLDPLYNDLSSGYVRYAKWQWAPSCATKNATMYPPPHFFGNFKELLRKRCFNSPPPLWVIIQPHPPPPHTHTFKVAPQVLLSLWNSERWRLTWYIEHQPFFPYKKLRLKNV